MKKSWFVFLVVFLTLFLVGIGLYFFFPSFQKIGNTTLPTDNPLFGTINDNGQNNSSNTPNGTQGIDTPEIIISETPSTQGSSFKAFKIGDYSVSSLQPLDFKVGTTSTTTLLVSVGKGSGVVRLYDPQTEVTSIIGTISVPNIIKSEFTSNGTYVVVQSQDGDTLKTIVLKNTPRTPTEERFFSPIFSSSLVTSFFIEENTIYFIEKITSGSELYEYTPSTNKRTLLYRGLFTDLYGFARGGKVFLGTKPAANTQGFIFTLNKTRGLMTKIASGNTLSGIPNQNGDTVLTTEFFNTVSQVRLLEIATKKTLSLSVKALKDKCTPDLSTRTFIFCGVPNTVTENMPDSWYMGKISTNDSLYLIDSERGSFSILTTTDEVVDVIHPSSSRYSGILTFVNKKTSNPWIVISK